MTGKPVAKPAPLGRGLSALFGDTDSGYTPRPAAQAHGAPARKDNEARTLPVTDLQPGVYQPRRRFDKEAIDELADSIRERGVLTPLLVRPIDGEKDAYEIIAGERRWRAAQLAGLHDVPVIVRSMSDREAMEIGLIENVQRQDLSPAEEAEGYKRLLDEFHHTQEGLSKIVGKSRPHITNLLRLLTLPEPVKEMINAGTLTMGQARPIITAKDPAALAKEIVKKGLSARQAEALAKKQSDGRFAKKDRVSAHTDPNIIALEKDLSGLLGLKTRLHVYGESGTVTIHYNNLDQLDALLRQLRPE